MSDEKDLNSETKATLAKIEEMPMRQENQGILKDASDEDLESALGNIGPENVKKYTREQMINAAIGFKEVLDARDKDPVQIAKAEVGQSSVDSGQWKKKTEEIDNFWKEHENVLMDGLKYVRQSNETREPLLPNEATAFIEVAKYLKNLLLEEKKAA